LGKGLFGGRWNVFCKKFLYFLVFFLPWGGGGGGGGGRAAQLDTRRTLPPVNTASRTSDAGARYDMFW